MSDSAPLPQTGPDSGEFINVDAGFQAAINYTAEQQRTIQKLRETLVRLAYKLHINCHQDPLGGDRGWQFCRYATCQEAKLRVFG